LKGQVSLKKLPEKCRDFTFPKGGGAKSFIFIRQYDMIREKSENWCWACAVGTRPTPIFGYFFKCGIVTPGNE
jgi:hypothetical protein